MYILKNYSSGDEFQSTQEPAKKSFTEWKTQEPKSELPREAECILQVEKSTEWVVVEAVVSLAGEEPSISDFKEVRHSCFLFFLFLLFKNKYSFPCVLDGAKGRKRG